MSITLAAICRHPVKSLGEELLEAVTLSTGKPLPWDRIWAICHANSAFDATSGAWTSPGDFINQAWAPRFVQVQMRFDEASGVLHLDHPDLAPLSVSPADDPQKLCDWIVPLGEPVRPGPYRLARCSQGAFTDFEDTDISIASESSRRALGELAGTPLAHVRFRMNLWVDGAAPFEELDWVDREISVGSARLRITARDKRCNATAANPRTGVRDVQIPALLKREFGHMDFGVYAQVVEGGEIRPGDPVTL